MTQPGLDRRSLERLARRSYGPWGADQLTWLIAAQLVGAVLIFAGFWSARNAETASAQLGWLNLAIVGIVVAGLTNAWFLSRGHRVVTLAKRSLFPELRAEVDTLAPAAADDLADGLVAIAGTRRFHRSDCLLVVGKGAAASSEADHRAAGQVACEVCLP